MANHTPAGLWSYTHVSSRFFALLHAALFPCGNWGNEDPLCHSDRRKCFLSSEEVPRGLACNPLATENPNMATHTQPPTLLPLPRPLRHGRRNDRTVLLGAVVIRQERKTSRFTGEAPGRLFVSNWLLGFFCFLLVSVRIKGTIGESCSSLNNSAGSYCQITLPLLPFWIRKKQPLKRSKGRGNDKRYNLNRHVLITPIFPLRSEIFTEMLMLDCFHATVSWLDIYMTNNKISKNSRDKMRNYQRQQPYIFSLNILRYNSIYCVLVVLNTEILLKWSSECVYMLKEASLSQSEPFIHHIYECSAVQANDSRPVGSFTALNSLTQTRLWQLMTALLW